jgi:hypothetical protein
LLWNGSSDIRPILIDTGLTRHAPRALQLCLKDADLQWSHYPPRRSIGYNALMGRTLISPRQSSSFRTRNRSLTICCVELDDAFHHTMKYPYPNSEQTDARAFTFITRGLWFDVVTRDPLPEYVYDSCCLNSRGKLIFVGDFQQVHHVGSLSRTSRLQNSRRNSRLERLPNCAEYDLLALATTNRIERP